MVTTENGVRMTDMELRHAVEEIMERRNWSTNRIAAEIRSSEDKLVTWLEHSHVTAMTQFRANLLEFVREWRAAPIELAPAVIAEPSLAEEAADIRIAETSPGLWSLPAGFEAIAPAAGAHAIRPAGIGIHKDHERAAISTALFVALGKPERVLVACNPLTKELVVSPAREGLPAMKLTKGHHVSKSVALRAKAMGVAPGFYQATDAGDGTWKIKLEAAA